jgi:hypothetical protein
MASSIDEPSPEDFRLPNSALLTDASSSLRCAGGAAKRER